MVGFLPLVYLRALKKERFIRVIFGVFVFGGILLAFGIVFILPSYFSLIFSLDDVLRSLGTEEVAVKRKDVEGLESKIFYNNSLLDSYFQGESKRKSFSQILLQITNSVSNEVKLKSIEFQKTKDGEFVFHIRGEAKKRNALIIFSQKLRQLEEIKELRSPISNLLQEENIKFLLEAVINLKFYEYKD